MSIRVEHGDCLEVMPRLIAEGVRVDSVVTDPPYHLTSIVKRFGKPGSAPAKDRDGLYARASRGFMGKEWDGGDVAFRPETWRLCFDLMKPGAYILAFGSCRGYGRLQVAMEEAGFITHPMIAWLFGSGFPKATRLKAPDTDHLRYGLQALKPALEPIYMGQKPMEGTGTENWLAHGTGALNIDGCRVSASGESTRRRNRAEMGYHGGNLPDEYETGSDAGRWPANVIHDGSPEVLAAFAAYGEKASGSGVKAPPGKTHGFMEGRRSFRNDSNREYRGDTGTAARFFYSAKANADDRLGSKHPTVKPVDLIAYLCRLVTPPGGLVLDPFGGSGTTAAACLREGFRALLIEREAEYVADIRRRLAHVRGEDAPLFSARPRYASGWPQDWGIEPPEERG